MLVDSGVAPFARLGFLRGGEIRRRCRGLVEAFDIRTPGLETPVRNLSGGNIQKLIMARELSRRPRLLLVAQPTRGIDVAAAQYIHDRLREQRDAGTGVLIVSEDLDEVLALADRILVVYEGAIIGEATASATSRGEIGLMMAGVRSGAAGGDHAAARGEHPPAARPAS
jgi:simple sugar transport system ATP-binding protein